MAKQALAINSPAPPWLIDAMREAILWSDNEEPHKLMAGVIWDAFKAHGLHPHGIGGTKRYSNIPVVVIPVDAIPIEVDSESPS